MNRIEAIWWHVFNLIVYSKFQIMVAQFFISLGAWPLALWIHHCTYVLYVTPYGSSDQVVR